MNISALAVRRRVTIVMATLIITLLGSVSYGRIPVDLFPDVVYPGMAVITTYPGASPEEVEAAITRPLEAVLSTVAHVEEIFSTSSFERSVINLQFNWGTDMDLAALEVRQRLDDIRRFLPEASSAARITRYDPSTMPILTLAVSGKRSLAELNHFTTQVVIRRLERLPGVASVNVSGGEETVIAVEVQGDKLSQFNLTLSQIGAVLRGASINVPGGSIVQGGQSYNIRTINRLTSLADIENLVVGAVVAVTPSSTDVSGGSISFPSAMQPVYLKDVATVSEQVSRGQALIRLNGENSVLLTLQKQSGANTIAVAAAVEAEMGRIMSDHSGFVLTATQNQARYINKAMEMVTGSAILGGLLAVLVLFAFLRNLRSTLIIAVAIPVSVISTMILLYFGNLTLNLLTLSGLALGIGMLVDNSIVVLESIYRHIERGEKRAEAARKGAAEVSLAITASTLTTIAVFLPIVFVGGLTGILFKDLALTVTFSLLTSLGVALTVIPMLSASILKEQDQWEKKGIFSRVKKHYDRMLRWNLRHRLKTVLIAVLLLGLSLAALPRIGGEFMPQGISEEFRIFVNMSADSTRETLLEVVTELEAYVLSFPEVELVQSHTGTTATMIANAGLRATLTVITDIDQPHASGMVMSGIRAHSMEDYDKAQITLRQSSIGLSTFAGGTVAIEIAGPSLERLASYAVEVQNVLDETPGFVDVSNSLSQELPQLQVHVDMEKAALQGVSPMAVASAIRMAVVGETVSILEREGRTSNIRMTLQKDDEVDLAWLQDIKVSTVQGQGVSVGDVAKIVTEAGPRTITRRDNERYVTVTSGLEDMDLRTAQKEIERKMAELNLTDEYTFAFSGQIEQMQEAFGNLLLALLLAVALVYMVMAAQFESFIHPFVIMFTLPLAAIGVLVALFIVGYPLSVPTFIGIIILSGIVVNNAIVLVDYINQMKGQGLPQLEAIVEASQTRLRPILMTALTTILALIPLALRTGAGAEMQRPLAISVIGGLITATLLTLIVIPVVYSVFDSLKRPWLRSD